MEKTEALHQRLNRLSDMVGALLVDAFHYLALFAIGSAVVWAAVHAFAGMVANGRASVEDILLLFIYLELGAMVGIYFKTKHMPVRFLIYVGIPALTRLLVGDVAAHHKLDWGIVPVPVAILLLALSSLVVRYGSARVPSTAASDRPRASPGPRSRARAVPGSSWPARTRRRTALPDAPAPTPSSWSSKTSLRRSCGRRLARMPPRCSTNGAPRARLPACASIRSRPAAATTWSGCSRAGRISS